MFDVVISIMELCATIMMACATVVLGLLFLDNEGIIELKRKHKKNAR